jgi:hypothetical protein
MELKDAELSIYQAIKMDEGHSLTATANACMENPVLLLDCGFHPLFHHSEPPSSDYEAQLAQARMVLEQAGSNCDTVHGGSGETWLVEPVLVQGILIGYATVCNTLRDFLPEDRALLQCVANATGIQCSMYSQLVQESDLSTHAHRMLFDDLLDMQLPHAKDLQRRLDEIHWTAYKGLYVMNVALRDVPFSAQFPMLQSAISQQIHRIVPVYTYTYHFNQLVLLLCFGDVPEPAMTDTQFESLEQILKNMELQGGISQRLYQLSDANEAFAQAQMAVEMPQKLHLGGNLHTYDSVALYHMIQISQSKIRDYHTFMHRGISILQKYDQAHHQELLSTLHVYLRESQRPGITAERLCIHKNTLFYRLRKIKELTGIDLERSDEVLHLQISFLIMQYDGYFLA